MDQTDVLYKIRKEIINFTQIPNKQTRATEHCVEYRWDETESPICLARN